MASWSTPASAATAIARAASSRLPALRAARAAATSSSRRASSSGLLLLLLLLLKVRLCAHRAIFFARDLGREKGNANGVRRDGVRGRSVR